MISSAPMVGVTKVRSNFGSFRFASFETVRKVRGFLNASPVKRILAIRKGLHLCDPPFLKSVDVCEPYLLPRATAFRQHACIDEDDNPIAGGNKSLRLTDHLGCSGSRLAEVALRAVDTVIRASPRKLGWLGPFDVWVKQLHRRIDITTVKRRISGAKSGNCLFGLLRIEHVVLLLRLMAPGGDQEFETENKPECSQSVLNE